MTAIHLVAAVVHTLVCIVVVVLSVDLMNQRRSQKSWRDPIVWAIYMVGVGSFAYMFEAFHGWRPTLADMFFETGVAIYLLVRVVRSKPPNELGQAGNVGADR